MVKGFLLLSIALFPLALPPSFQEQGVQEPKTPPIARKGGFLDDPAACADCHLEALEGFEKGPHSRILETRGLHGCEGCHGPGEDHADEQEPSQITLPRKLDIRSLERLCAGCHDRQIREHGGPWSDLRRAGKRCTDCHRLHDPRPRRPGEAFPSREVQAEAARPVGPETCLSCHVSKKENLEKGPHRSLLRSDADRRDGVRACEACHGPGSRHVAQEGARGGITRPDEALDGVRTCRSCHADLDARAFHWKGEEAPLLGSPAGTLRCTDCHAVHRSSIEVDSRAPNRTCLSCHAPAFEILGKSVHRDLARLDHPRGCLGCHPGGLRHARAGGAEPVSTLRGRAKVGEAACLRCHEREGRARGHRDSIHGKAEVSCLGCHEPAPEEGRTSTAARVDRRCRSCHPGVAGDFRRIHRHPLGEPGFHCSSCHPPHEILPASPVSPRRNLELCIRCHREQRGPFVFPHRAMEGEGCLACHRPHGSTNPLLLRTRRARDLCLACHADLPSFHDQSPGSKFRNCLTCHVKVHGSQRHRYFFR